MRMIHNRENNTLDMGNHRATDSKFNKMIFQPKARTPNEEADILIKNKMHMKVIQEYINYKFNTKGDIKEQPHNK